MSDDQNNITDVSKQQEIQKKIENMNEIDFKKLNINETYDIITQFDIALQKVRKEKTNVTASEFYSEYSVLYTKEVHNLPLDIGEDISARWEKRIDRFKPINIIDDKTQEVLFTLPAMYNRLTLLNSFEGKVKDTVLGNDMPATDLPIAFNNITSRSDSMKQKALAVNNLVQASRLAQKNTSFEKQIQENDKIFEQFKKQKYDPDAPILENSDIQDTNNPILDIDTSEMDIEWE
jgi:hypothetical protein